MTPLELIDRVREFKPCILENTALLSFLSTIEAKIRLIINNETGFESLKYENIDTDELLLTEEFAEVYIYYVASQIDLFSSDIPSYNNFTMLHNNAMREYMNYLKARKQLSPARRYDYEGAFRKWNYLF